MLLVLLIHHFLLTEFYGIGVLAVGISFCSSCFLDTNICCWKGKLLDSFPPFGFILNASPNSKAIGLGCISCEFDS